MNNDSFDWACKARVDRVTADGMVSPTGGFVFSILIANSATGASLAKLYDGESTEGIQKADFNMLASTTFQYRFDPPLQFMRGIYVVVGANTTSVSIHYLPLKS